MSLGNKNKGNPNWKKGMPSANPQGRPKEAKSLKTILRVAATLADKKRHPVHELIRLADEAERSTQSVVIVSPGCTSWKIGQIVSRAEWDITIGTIKGKDESQKPTAKPIPGSTGGRELAADIWRDLLRYCEPQKKAQEVLPEKALTPEESKANAEAAYQALQELENGTSGEDTSPTSSDQTRLAERETQVPSEAVPEDYLRSDKGE